MIASPTNDPANITQPPANVGHTLLVRDLAYNVNLQLLEKIFEPFYVIKVVLKR